MYEYNWYQWLAFFYVYCFFGWIFESTYVSVRQRHFVNRGFLRLPLLPLYGTGAVMMLWVSLPVKEYLPLVYFSGVVAATILEYVTGWAMEQLFKMKYWDYSDQRFNLNGYICLSSSIAWGFLTIFLTEVIHKPIEQYVMGLPSMITLGGVCLISILFTADAAGSVKAALDLAKVLDAMTRMRAEFDEAQVQIALLKEETKDLVWETRENVASRLELAKAEAAARAAQLYENAAERVESLAETTADRIEMIAETKTSMEMYWQKDRAERLALLSERVAQLKEKHHSLISRMSFYHKGILKGNPSASSARFAKALEELKESVRREKKS